MMGNGKENKIPKLKDMISESPDQIKVNGKIYDWTDPKTYPFGYHDDVLKIGKERGKHYDMSKSEGRYYYEFPGRVWATLGIISFWEMYPSPAELKQIIKDFKKRGIVIKFIDVPRRNRHGDYGEFDVESIQSKIISVDEYINTFYQKPVPKQIKRFQHEMPPSAKTKDRDTKGYGADKRPGGLAQWQRDAMKGVAERKIPKLRDMIAESPDRVITKNGNSIHYINSFARPFGYYNGEFYCATYNGTHYGLVPGKKPDREEYVFPGRLWLGYNIISFWGKYPSPTELKKIMKDLNEKGIEIDDTWDIEIPINNNIFSDYSDQHGEVISIKKYLSSRSETPTNVFNNIQHETPPAVKVRDMKDRKGYGADKRPGGLTQWQRDAMKGVAEDKK